MLVQSLARCGLVAALVVGFASTEASAQEKGKVGIAMGYPSSVGVIWHITDQIALRPEIAFEQDSSEVTGPGFITTSDTTSGWTVVTGISGLFYFRSLDGVHLYASPRWTYGHSTESGAATDFTMTGWSLAGSLGAQYALGKHFGVFGEVGLDYSHSRTTSNSTSPLLTVAGHTTGTRTAVGAIVYF